MAAALQRALTRLAWGSVLVGGTVALAQSSLYNVDAGEAAVMFNRVKGVEQEVQGEGTHVMIPGIQRPIIFDIRIRPKVINTSTPSNDLQTVNLSLRVLHRPQVEYLPYIYQTVGLDYDERVLPSIGNDVLKAVVAQYDAVSMITKRDQVSQMIRAELTKRAKEFHIILEDVALTHLTFGQEFTQAIERKQVAEQEAERAKYNVEKFKQEALAAKIRAEGEARSAELIREATLLGSGFVELRRIQAAAEIAETLARSRGVTYLPASAAAGAGGVGMLLNVQ